MRGTILILFSGQQSAALSRIPGVRMQAELDMLIDESLLLRNRISGLREEYEEKRRHILELLNAADMKTYVHGSCRVVRTEAVSIESVSKELLIDALREVDIPRDKKVFIWKHAIREIQRPATVMLMQSRPSPGAAPQIPGRTN